VSRYSITHAAAYDGGQLRAVLDRDNIASEVGRYLPIARRPGSPCSSAAVSNRNFSARSPEAAAGCRFEGPAQLAVPTDMHGGCYANQICRIKVADGRSKLRASLSQHTAVAGLMFTGMRTRAASLP
jgi:hypothetical protein